MHLADYQFKHLPFCAFLEKWFSTLVIAHSVPGTILGTFFVSLHLFISFLRKKRSEGWTERGVVKALTYFTLFLKVQAANIHTKLLNTAQRLFWYVAISN